MKAKALISFTVTAKLICAFVFAKFRFSYGAAHVMKTNMIDLWEVVPKQLFTPFCCLLISSASFIGCSKLIVFRKSVSLSDKASKISFCLTKYFILSVKCPAEITKITIIMYRTILQNWVLSCKKLQSVWS